MISFYNIQFFKIVNKTNLVIICLIPFSLISPFLSDFFVVLSSILFLISFLLNKEKKINIFPLIYIFIFLLYLIFLSLISDHIYNSLSSTLFYFRFFLFSFSVCYISTIYKNFLYLFCIFLFVTITFFSFDGIFQYYFGYNFIGLENKFPTSEIGDGDPRRISGFFGDELILGSFISRMLPLSIGLILFFNYKKKIFNNFKLIFFYILISSIAITMSGERVAFFNLSLFLIFLSIILLTMNKKYFLSIFILLFLLGSLIFTNSKIYNRLINDTLIGMGIKDNYEQIDKHLAVNKDFIIFTPHHTAHYLSAYKMFVKNPFFGVGPKNFRLKCAEPAYFIENACSTHPHNTYLQLLSEGGIFLTLVIFSFFLYSTFFLFKSLKNFLSFRNNVSILRYFIFASIIINIMPLIPSGNFFNNWISIVYFIPIAFMLIPKNTLQDANAS